MDLRTVIEWAGQASVPGTAANTKLVEGLRPLLFGDSSVAVRNPTSSRDNGVAPALTRVLLCSTTASEPTSEFCVKLYPRSADGIASMRRHEILLRELSNTVPVPQVIEAIPSGDRLGFPALITTTIGDPVDQMMHELPADARANAVKDFGTVIATLHQRDLNRFPIERDYDPGNLLSVWREDSVWYRNNAHRAQGHSNLVVEAADILATREDVPRTGSLIHRDLTPYNVVLMGDEFVGIVDWDHAGVSAAQEDVAKAVIGLLIISSVSCDERLQLAAGFLSAYASGSDVSPSELLEHCVPFALDTILDWVIGIKNAPRDELVWATRQIVERNCI